MNPLRFGSRLARPLLTGYFALLFPLLLEASAPAPNLALSNPTQKTIRVQWEIIQGSSRYELSYGTDRNASNRQQIFTNQSAHTLEELLPNTIYYVKVRAVLDGRAGLWSQIKSMSTQIPVMNDLIAENIQEASVYLSWSDKYSDLPDTFYEIAYGTDTDASSDGLLTTEKAFITLRNLIPETNYYIKIRVRNPQAAGPWSRPLAITTLSSSDRTSDAVISITPLTGSEIQLSWPGIKEATAYDLAYGSNPIAENMGIIPLDSNRFKLRLAPNTQYYFKVRGIAAGVSGSWSSIVPYVSLPAQPRGLKILSRTGDSVTLGWESLAGSQNARFYILQWGTDKDGSNQGSVNATNTSYTFENLKSNTDFRVRIKTVNQTGQSVWSETLTFSTIPLVIEDLQVFEIKHTSALVRWSPLKSVLSYEVAYGPELSGEIQRSASVSGSPAKLTDLFPNSRYFVKVRPLFANQTWGAWSNLLAFDSFPQPPKMKSPRLVEVSGTQVQIQWNEIPDINTYDISINPNDLPDEGRIESSQKTSFMVSKLERNSVYFLMLRAVNLGGPGPWSNRIRVVTLPEQAPAGLTVSNITPHEALITWEDLPGSTKASYEFRYSSDGQKWFTTANVPSRSFNASELEPDSEYRCQVRACNETGCSPWSEVKKFTTPEAPPEKAPEGLRVKETSDVTFTLEWQALRGRNLVYLLSSGTDMDASSQGVLELRQLQYTLVGLVPDKSYYFKIKARNATGEGPWSDILLVTTLPAAPISAPANVTVSQVSATTATVSWDSMAGVLRYEITLQKSQESENTVRPSTTVKNEYIFGGLKPGTTYQVKVRGINRGGPGPWSPVRQWATSKK